MDAYRETLHQHFHAAIQVFSQMSLFLKSLNSKLKKLPQKMTDHQQIRKLTTATERLQQS